MQERSKDIEKALIRRALGYDAEDVVEEFAFDEANNKKLIKRKVSKKHYSPDVSAIKILLEHFGDKQLDEIERMSTEELERERDRLLKLLQNPQNKTKKRGRDEK